MIVGFRVMDAVVVFNTLEVLKFKNNKLDEGDGFKDSSKRMVEFTTGSPFSFFDYKYTIDEESLVFMVKLEFRRITPKADFFFNFLAGLFGLNNFCRFAIKKVLRKKGYNGLFIKVKDKELLEIFGWGVPVVR